MNRHPLRCAGLACLFATSAHAATLDAPAAVPAQPLWELGLAGGVVSAPSYPGADDRETRALGLPLLIYRGKIFRADQSGIGARLFRTDAAELDVGLAASLPARSDDVEARAGMPDPGALAEFGPRLKLRLARFDGYSGLRAELPLRAVMEVRSGVRHQGYTFEPRLAYDRRSMDGKWLFETNLSAVVGDGKINRYFYEVRPEYATATRPAYQAKSGLVLVRAGLFVARAINRDLRAYGFVRAENYGAGANDNSPLHLRDNGVSAGFGLSWTFKRSAALASE
ncbi:MipA/OmpV family protein [Massilia sp. Se16.2.3]|uniref:MipA/OmpV family protein n=1 Tax=Massilia sp. Se16.2.3 TaxID=2709303 RepID=UPI0016036254|nr:MipA/OmpV family protein [Massilia sp. Se16.2.3]QNA98998.1 MipA/OmpV family protein [Massilia sp. Se16.2.3]